MPIVIRALLRPYGGCVLQVDPGTSPSDRGDAGALLELVIAHDLGHLLRGEGHSEDGVMRTPWNGNEINAMHQRWLKFNAGDAARIRRELQAKSGS